MANPIASMTNSWRTKLADYMLDSAANPLPTLAHFVWGSGGHDGSGPLAQDPTRTALITETLRLAIQAGDKIKNGPFATDVTGSLDDTQLLDQTISEFGILDSDLQLAYYFNFGPNIKRAGEVYQQLITVKF